MGHPIKAFTLIELLVVISIVALLLSILLPALKGAREQAKIAMCSANLRAIASASITYAASDRHEQAIPVHRLTGVGPGDFGAYDWGGKAGAGEFSGDPLTSIWGTQSGRGPATRPLNDVLFKDGFRDYKDEPGPNQVNWAADTNLNLAQFRCPSDRGYTGHHYTLWKDSHLTSYDHYGTSYTSDTLASGVSDGAELGYSKLQMVGPFMHGMSRIHNPANSVYYMENCGRFAWHISRGNGFDLAMCHYGEGIWGTPEGELLVKGWHGRPYHFATAFVDGHVRLVKMKGFQLPPPRLSHTPGMIGQINYHDINWWCVTVRGPGWQMDTLPSPAIVVPIDYDLYAPAHQEIR